MENLTKEKIENQGKFTGKIRFGIAKVFKWHEYKLKGKYYNVSQFNNDFYLIGGYSDFSGNYTKNLKEL